MRYIRIALLLTGLGLVALALEASGMLGHHSLTDRRSLGKVVLLILVLVSIVLFAHYVARVSAIRFSARYVVEWRRALAGFGFMALATILVAIAGYALLGSLGGVHWSPEALGRLLDNAARRIAVAMLIALVLVSAEEIIFRGFLLRYFRYDDTLPVTVSAVVMSSAIFSASHLITMIGVPAETDKLPLLVGLFIIGLLLGTAYVATGSLFCSIGIHFGLVGFKVVLIKSGLFQLTQDWVVDGREDIRMVPLAWITFLAMTAAIISYRGWLKSRFAVETATCPDGGGEFAVKTTPTPR